MDEIAEMARRAARLVAEEAAGVPEELAKRLYESAVAEIRKSVSAGTAGLVDVTALRSSIEKAFDASTVARFAEDALGRAVGDSAAGAVRERIEDSLGGRLPPEVVDAINRAPVEFESYASRVERNLPGRKLKELKDSILSRPILKIPTCAYAAILATSAAEHYARAYKGVTVDLYELKRAGEVTKEIGRASCRERV